MHKGDTPSCHKCVKDPREFISYGLILRQSQTLGVPNYGLSATFEFPNICKFEMVPNWVIFEDLDISAMCKCFLWILLYHARKLASLQ